MEIGMWIVIVLMHVVLAYVSSYKVVLVCIVLTIVLYQIIKKLRSPALSDEMKGFRDFPKLPVFTKIPTHCDTCSCNLVENHMHDAQPNDRLCDHCHILYRDGKKLMLIVN